MGSPGSASNKLYYPFILAWDSSNALYVSDGFNNRIQRWVIGALNGSTVCGNANGIAGSTGSTFNEPVGIVLDSSNNVYATDFNNNRVQFWLSGASSGTTVAGVTGNERRATESKAQRKLGERRSRQVFVDSSNVIICPIEQSVCDYFGEK